MRRRRRDAALLLFALLGATDASYVCSNLGLECLNRIYTGSYPTEAATKAACDAEPACVAYDFALAQDLGFKCSTTTQRTDHYNEFKMCTKPAPPPSPPPPSPPPRPGPASCTDRV